MRTIIVVLSILYYVNCELCTEVERENITNGVLYDNGSVIYDGFEYVKGTFWQVELSDGVVRYGCPCIGRTCMWKCCGPGQAYFDAECKNTSLDIVNPFNPPLYKGKEVSTMQAADQFLYRHGHICKGYLVDTSIENEYLYIQENGTLMDFSMNEFQWHAPGQFCVDMMVDNYSVTPRLVAVPCFPDTVSTDDSSILYTAYAIGLILSVPFLLATFLVYALIPELRNLHGMCLMAYCGGLIVAYPFLAYLKLYTGTIGVAMTGCLVVAFITYFAFQTSFFWLNVMCFDIWRTFSGYRGGTTNKRREQRRFAFYGLYAWGIPLLLTACTAGMQFGNFSSAVITPGFGSKRCWFEDWLSELVYFFSPVLVLVLCNILLFSVTAYRIRSIRQETAILKGSESSRSDKLKKDKQRYGLYLKLFVVMGVNWSVELISFAVGGSNWYWVVVDIANIILGVYIFFIFVWKKKVRNLVQKRFRNLRGVTSETEMRTGRWTSSSVPSEDTRVTNDDTTLKLKDYR